MTNVACDSKLCPVMRLSMHPCPGNKVAIVSAVVYYARAVHAFSAGIRCWHCICTLVKHDSSGGGIAIRNVPHSVNTSCGLTSYLKMANYFFHFKLTSIAIYVRSVNISTYLISVLDVQATEGFRGVSSELPWAVI